MDEFDLLGMVKRHAVKFSADPIDSISKITDGSINETFEVKTTTGGIFILQQMSSIFPTTVMDNLALVEPYAKEAGVSIPHRIKTVAGDTYVVNGGGSWYRALTYIPGVTMHSGVTSTSAESAGRLVGQFHSALVGCDGELTEAIRHFHDTHFYLERMNKIASECTDELKRGALQPIVEEITDLATGLNTDVRTLPQRIIHADLKISNIRFDESGEAIAIIDMDTMMRGSIVTEMGDALRSWCGTAGEDCAEQVFDEKVCKAGIRGYVGAASGITDEEIAAIPEGICILTLELASRFVTDAYEEEYFSLSSHYSSLFEQNKTRAVNQLGFLKAFEAKRSLL